MAPPRRTSTTPTRPSCSPLSILGASVCGGCTGLQAWEGCLGWQLGLPENPLQCGSVQLTLAGWSYPLSGAVVSVPLPCALAGCRNVKSNIARNSVLDGGTWVRAAVLRKICTLAVEAPRSCRLVRACAARSQKSPACGTRRGRQPRSRHSPPSCTAACTNTTEFDRWVREEWEPRYYSADLPMMTASDGGPCGRLRCPAATRTCSVLASCLPVLPHSSIALAMAGGCATQGAAQKPAAPARAAAERATGHSAHAWPPSPNTALLCSGRNDLQDGCGSHAPAAHVDGPRRERGILLEALLQVGGCSRAAAGWRAERRMANCCQLCVVLPLSSAPGRCANRACSAHQLRCSAASHRPCASPEGILDQQCSFSAGHLPPPGDLQAHDHPAGAVESHRLGLR